MEETNSHTLKSSPVKSEEQEFDSLKQIVAEQNQVLQYLGTY